MCALENPTNIEKQLPCHSEENPALHIHTYILYSIWSTLCASTSILLLQMYSQFGNFGSDCYVCRDEMACSGVVYMHAHVGTFASVQGPYMYMHVDVSILLLFKEEVLAKVQFKLNPLLCLM